METNADEAPGTLVEFLDDGATVLLYIVRARLACI